jgi:predicted RNA-binding Zn-ribbon protein involved in translation (DUF1610 family)
VGACPTCGHEVCELCLRTVAVLDEFECPACGDFGVVIYDGDPREDSSDARDPLHFRNVAK